MKNRLTIVFCLIGISSAFAQIEFKGFVEGQYIQYEYFTQDDSIFYLRAENGLRVTPSFAVSFYRIDRAFHELALSNLNFSRQSSTVQNSANPTIQTDGRSMDFRFRYNYNFCILKAPNRWNPYVGLQTNHAFSRNKNEQGTNEIKTTSVRSSAGVAAGVQFKIKENFRLEIQVPVDFVQFTYQRQFLASSQVPNGEIRHYVDTRFQERPFRAIPVRLGLALRI